MGGSGSGRIGGKTLTSQMMQLDVRILHRHGVISKAALSPINLQHKGRNEYESIHIYVNARQLTINYFYKGYSGECHPVNIIINFDWTSCHYGGYRPWFLCPKCGKRVAILYGGKHFHCRFCRNLAYPSENESPANRMLQKANKIKRRLNCEPGVQNRIMFKPKGMHQKTFDRLLRQVHMLENIAVKQLYQNLTRNQDLQ
jgi:hypothetical protein